MLKLLSSDPRRLLFSLDALNLLFNAAQAGSVEYDHFLPHWLYNDCSPALRLFGHCSPWHDAAVMFQTIGFTAGRVPALFASGCMPKLPFLYEPTRVQNALAFFRNVN